MTQLLKPLSLIATIFAAAMFGFFFAWVSSTMWGLDASDPRIAISAMQAMNASVRNMVFGIAFFGTVPILVLTAVWAYASGARQTALGFAIASAFAAGSVAITFTVHVPMNLSLAALEVPTDQADARAVWAAYAPPWQVWNAVRTVTSGFAVAAASWALMCAPRGARG